VAKELEQQGALGVHFDACDIRDYGQVERFVGGVRQKLGDATILVNNAGGYLLACFTNDLLASAFA